MSVKHECKEKASKREVAMDDDDDQGDSSDEELGVVDTGLEPYEESHTPAPFKCAST